MKNTIRLITTFLFTLIGLGINAQEKAGILYKISGNGLEEPSFLFGTMHMICEEYFNQSGSLEAVMSQVDHVVMELDMDDPAVAAEMKKYSANPKEVKEINQLAASKKDMIDTWFQLNYGMGLENLDTLRPFAIYSLMVPKFMSCDRLISLEMEIVSSARASRKEISGLETVQEQIAIFEEIPAEEQLSWIMQMINNEQYYKDEMTKMMQAYADQDLELLNEITINSPEFGEHLDIMLYQRNKNWIEKIRSASAEQSTLFAVGAGHLGGDQGVIALLKNAGYTVEPF